jgi:hypothetical protein
MLNLEEIEQPYDNTYAYFVNVYDQEITFQENESVSYSLYINSLETGENIYPSTYTTSILDDGFVNCNDLWLYVPYDNYSVDALSDQLIIDPQLVFPKKGLYFIQMNGLIDGVSTNIRCTSITLPDGTTIEWDGIRSFENITTLDPKFIKLEKENLPEGYPWAEKRETIDFRIPLDSNRYYEGTFYHVSDEHLNWNAPVTGEVSISAIVDGFEITDSMSAIEISQMSKVSIGAYVFNQDLGILYCEEDNTDIPLETTVIHVQKRGLYFGDFCIMRDGNTLGSIKIVSFTYFDGMNISWDGSPYIIEKMDPKFLQIEQHNLPEGYPWKHEDGQVKIDMTKFFEGFYGGSFPPETMMLVHVSDEIPPLDVGKQVEAFIQFGPDQD